MSEPQVVELPQHTEVKRRPGRPKKVQSAEVNSTPNATVQVVQEPEAIPKRSALMLDQNAEVVLNSRRKYGNKEEVFKGLFESTRSGLKKSDLTQTKNGKIVSHKQLKALTDATARIRKAPAVESS